MASSKTFRFQRFSIADDRCAMKIGTDGVLLGAWADITDAKSVLDIGTGCGIVALMLAQRTESCETDITGIEIDEAAAQQARDNFGNSPWKDRLKVAHASLQTFASVRNERSTKYDLCVCNPPYFEQSMLAESRTKSLARHAVELTRNELFETTARLLNSEGRFCLILPFDQLQQTTDVAVKHGFVLRRQTSVRPNPESSFKRVLLEYGLSMKTGQTTEATELIIETKRHEFTEAYAALTREFHLRYATD